MILCSPVGTLGATLSTRACATRQAVTAPHALSHLLMPTALAMRSLRSEVLMLEANMILEERGRRGKEEKWIGWLATRHRHNIRLMEYHITVSVVTCYLLLVMVYATRPPSPPTVQLAPAPLWYYGANLHTTRVRAPLRARPAITVEHGGSGASGSVPLSSTEDACGLSKGIH